MLPQERTYWTAAPLKNPWSSIHLIPCGNTARFNGIFLREIGLLSYSCDGATMSPPHDETLRAIFDCAPGRVATHFRNFVRPYLSLGMEAYATGGDSFRLRYSIHNHSREPREVRVRLGATSDRPAAKVETAGSATTWTFDLGDKATQPGAGFYDFSELREFYLANRFIPVTVRFPQEPEVTRRSRFAEGKPPVVEAEVAEVELTRAIPAGDVWHLDILLGIDTGERGETQLAARHETEWAAYEASLPSVQLASKAEAIAWQKSWTVLYFNEVRRRGMRWVLTGLNFPSMWVWDTSPFIVDAMLTCDPAFAQHLVCEQLRSMKTSGMIPLHAIEGIVHPEEVPNELTQTPTIAASALAVFRATGDKDFAAHVVNVLRRNYEWFEKYRRPVADIPLWGIHDRRAPYYYGPESGLDNCPIFRGGPAFCLTINGAKLAFERSMAELEAAIGNAEEAAKYAEAARSTQTFIHENMWDAEASYAFAMRYDRSLVRMKTADVFPAMYFGVFSDEQIAAMAKVLREEFLNEYGLFTVSKNEECFDPSDYSCGAVWPFLNRFAYRGLVRAGQKELAANLLDATIHSVTAFPGLFECFNPVERTLARVKDGPISFPYMSFTAGAIVGMLLDRGAADN
jgi:hypothetical protein